MNVLFWHKSPQGVYTANSGDTHFFIQKKEGSWCTNVLMGDNQYKSWQVTKTLKAAKAACEDYAYYHLCP